jgi:hypothetical protein
MPKQRLQVESGISPAGLTAPAQPVDTFVKTGEGAQLEQLAQGLSQLSPALGRFSDILTQRKTEADLATGQRTARDLANSAKSFREAIQAGKLLPSQSPWFMYGLHEQFGRLAADHLSADATVAAAQDSGLQSSTDMADYDKFLADFIPKWQDANIDPSERNLHFEKGFGARADAALADLRSNFAAQIAARVQKFANDGHFSEVMNSVITEAGRNTPHAAIGAAISQLNDDAIARGMNGTQVNVKTVDAVVAAAKRLNDSSLLDLLDTIKTGRPDNRGNRPSLATTQYGAAQIEQAQQEIAQQNQTLANIQWTKEERDHARAVATVYGNAIAALEASDDPGTVNLGPMREAMRVVAPEKVADLINLQKNYRDTTIPGDPVLTASAFRRVWTPYPGEQQTTEEDAGAMLANRQISRPDFTTLMNFIQERDRGGSKMANDPLLKQGQAQIRAMFAAEFGQGSAEQKQRAEEAVDEFTSQYLHYRQTEEGKNATEVQARAWIHDHRILAYRRMSEGADATTFDTTIPKAVIDTSSNPNAAPRPLDPSKGLVADPATISLIASEFQDLLRGTRRGLSARAISALVHAGIIPDQANIKAFLQLQNKFLDVPVPVDTLPPDATPHQ